MGKSPYSTTKLCACGCNKPSRTFSKYHSDQCRRALWDKKYRAAQRLAYKEKKKAQSTAECTCRDYGNCLVCRNSERRTAFKENRIPVYLSVIERT